MMDFTLDRAALRTAVPHVGKAVASRGGALPILSGVRVTADEHGVTFTSTDLEVTASYTFAGAEVAGHGSAVIPFAEIKAASKGKGTVRIVESDSVVVAGTGRVTSVTVTTDYTSEVRCLALDEWPRIAAVADGRPFTASIAPFAETLPATAGDGASRPILSCLRVEGDRVVATDSYRLHVAERPVHEVPFDVMVTRRPFAMIVAAASKAKADEMTVIVETDEEIREDRSTVATLTMSVTGPHGTATVTCREMEGEFPNYKGLIPSADTEPSAIVIADPSAISSAIATAFRGFGELNTPVRLMPDGPAVVARMIVQDRGEREVTLAGCSWDGPELTVAYNPDYLADLLAGMTAGTRFTMRDAQKPCVARDVDGRTRLLMPVRVS